MKRIFCLVLFCALAAPSAAQAQFFGPFFGGGFAPYQSPTQMVQDRRPITQNVGGPVQNPAMSSPNAYWNNLREPMPASYTMTPRTNLRTGNRGIDSATTSRGKSASTSQTSAKVKPKQHFLGFFNTSGLLVWPADAPLEGELSGKRAMVDTAMQQLKTDLTGTAPPPVSSIVSARNELLAYGRPALAYLREHRSNRADSFHAWMLELYNTLGDLAGR